MVTATPDNLVHAPALPGKADTPKVARVLLADSDLASRLAVKSILTAAGYAVSGAATSAEAIGKLDESEYQLVLADLRSESEEAGPGVLAYARQKEFRPATALIAADLLETEVPAADTAADVEEDSLVKMSNEDVSYLLDRVARLIGERADRRMRKAKLR